MTGLRALVEAVREARRVALARPGRDGQADAAAATLEAYLLDTPDVLAAVEAHPDAMEALAAVRALGAARAGQTAVRMNWRDGTEGHRERVAADQRAADARDDLFQLADRLAARKGE